MPPLVLLRDLAPPPRPGPDSLLPPPRFATVSFDSFRPQHPTQATARAEVEDFITQVGEGPRRRIWSRRVQPGQGLYLDGGFGVGKTHLLAAAFAASAAAPKRYMSFQELVYFIGVLGMRRAADELGDAHLLCIDEFELDDPGNTLIVKSFLTRVFERGGSVLTTSNTAPEAQGEGRFDASAFQREIQSLASRFRVASLDGEDFRSHARTGSWSSVTSFERLLRLEDARGPRVLAGWEELGATLARLHPSRYQGLLEQIGTLYLRDVVTLPSQNDALRFVHFIDKLYDLGVGLRATASVPLAELFHPSYRRSGYAKKHDRCLSRLGELLAEVEAETDSTLDDNHAAGNTVAVAAR